MPLALINQVAAARCEWLIPGILAEKVTQLIKTLPQKFRRHLVPVPEFAAAFCREVPPSNTPLLQALARYIREQKQVDVPLDAFRLEQLPPHLLMNFRIVDEHGRQLGMSRNFAQLHAELRRAPRPGESMAGAATQENGDSRFRAALYLVELRRLCRNQGRETRRTGCHAVQRAGG